MIVGPTRLLESLAAILLGTLLILFVAAVGLIWLVDPSSVLPFLIVALWVVLGCVAVGGLGAAFGALLVARNRAALRHHRLQRFVFVDGAVLERHGRDVEYRGLRKPLVGVERLKESVDLSQVEYASWAYDLIVGMREGVVDLWDRDPGLELSLLGPVPTDTEAQVVGELYLAALRRDTAAHRGVMAYLARRAEEGTFDSNVDLSTGEPIPEELPPLQPGVEVSKHGITYTKPGEAPDHDQDPAQKG